MKCPLCLDTDLDITYHAGIELDVCPKCRGVWLDRGELDRIAGIGESAPRPPGPGERRDVSDAWYDAPDAGRRMSPPPPGAGPKTGKKKSKKKNLADRLGDVFEEILDL